MKILFFGSKGWIGGQFKQALQAQGHTVVEAQSRADDPSAVSAEIKTSGCTHVIATIGRTHGPGVNSIDWLEEPGRLVDNLRDNLFAPLVLAETCRVENKHFTYLGTGCIFDDPVGERDYSETDEPDYFGSSYSVVKGFTDRLMSMYPEVLNLRIRMPLSQEDHPRNLISKLVKYPKICSLPNSMSVLPHLLPLAVRMSEKRIGGTVNLVNPGVITHDEILNMYKQYVDPTHTWTLITPDEQRTLLRAGRSTNRLSTTKLESLFPGEMVPIRESVEQLFVRWNQPFEYPAKSWEAMNWRFSCKDLDKMDMDKWRRSIHGETFDEWSDWSGRQHYRLLIEISRRCNNETIIDIGTHLGFSAFALSQNPTNTVYTFDIMDKVRCEAVLAQPNIHRVLEDFWNPEIRDKWRETVLSAKIIFLDVDPHNGVMETQFYQWLKDIGYRGYLVCDDIYYFKEMRDHFWRWIPDTYDLTKYGHFSGTGLVDFRGDAGLTAKRRDNSDWTLVTAYFDLTKCSDASRPIKERDADYYFSHALATLALPYNLLIYCDEASKERILSLRPLHLQDKTRFVIWDFDALKVPNDDRTFAEFRHTIHQNRVEHPYHFDERNTASYYLFCISRYLMLKDAIRTNPFGSTHFGWINFCIERMGARNLANLDEALGVHRDLFSTVYIDYQPKSLVENTHEYFQYGRCSMCSGFFTGGAEAMEEFCDRLLDKFLYYLNQGYGHADEQLFSAVYFEAPHIFEHYYGDYQSMITNYKYSEDYVDTTLRHFIPHSYDVDHPQCFKACDSIWRALNKHRCKLNQGQKQHLAHFTLVSSYYANQHQLSRHFIQAINSDPTLKMYVVSNTNLQFYENHYEIQ